MPTPLSYSFSIPSSLTGDKAVDSLISGTYWLGSNWSVFGPTNLSYSFITETTSYFATNYSPDNEYTNAYALTSAQQNAVISALSTWSAVANINFTQTSDTLTNVGDLRFGGYLSMDSQTAAWAYFPADTPYAGDVWIGPATNNANPVKGTYDYLTFVHEIGHALGLKHPFSASSTNATLLDASLDDVRYTVMSYNDSYSYQPTTPMLLDILAIQSLYGANTLWQSGNNTYSWASDQSIFETIWDAGGNDTIDGSNQLQSVRINLNEGAFSTIGKAFVDLTTQAAVTDGLAIAFGAKIENAIGSAFDDILIGNALDNALNGGTGADIMQGGNGNDVYYVDNVGDSITELATSSSGKDTVISSMSYVLGTNLENLTLTGASSLNGTGNALNNSLVGNTGNNILDGGLGADILIGGTGNDTYIVDNTQDVVSESSTQPNEIDNVLASVSFTLSANVENLTLSGTDNINAIGNAQNNILIGNTGNNALVGGAGLDTLIGGAGNDIYSLDQVGELALLQEIANEGLDGLNITYAATAQTNVIDMGQSSLQNVENVLLTGAGAFTVIGNDLDNILLGNNANNTLQGGTGNDQLDGGAGADTLSGGIGNDTFTVDNAGDTIIELADEGRDLIRTSISYTLSANAEDGQLLGTAAIDLYGNSLDNVLSGNSSDNTLNGGLGADTLIGGGGVDTYHVDNVGDVVVETDASLTAYDRVFSSIDYTLTANVENLLLTGIANLNGTGNGTGNRITGNDGNNILDGGLGADTLLGGLGNDTYIVDNLGDTVTEASTLASEIDTVRASVNWTLGANLENLILTGSNNLNGTGNGLGNVLTGNNGNNVLDGGLGADTLIGGLGNDTYIVDNLGDTITEASALASEIDTVRASMDWTLGANLENLILTGNAKLNGTGNSLDNTLTGNDQDNTLNGGLGADTLIGGGGVDTYHVDNVGDVVVETDASLTAYDRVFSSIDYTLTANVENLLLTGIANLNGTGNGTGNRITGNDGNNILDGGLGADTLLGGLGNDTYIVDNLGDTVTEASTLASEIDTVRASVSWTLGANLENLVLTGNANLNSTGNALNNVLTGNDGNNLINGGVGNDTLIGGLGIDTLTGGTGGDVFVFNAWNETGTGSSRDIITDFNSLQGDKIDLTKFDANLLQGGFNGFSFIGANDFTGAGQVRFIDNVLSGNVSGNAGADFEIQLVGVNTFSASDLVA
jgi:Ca2+-binding RTX toxin-like protein